MTEWLYGCWWEKKEKVKEKSQDSSLGNWVDSDETHKESQGREWMEEMSLSLVTELEVHVGQHMQGKQFSVWKSEDKNY